MGLTLDFDSGQTPLDPQEIEGLRLPFITTQGELNELEQLNIEEAMRWTIHRNMKPDVLFSEKFLKALHKRMYGDVWKWAGDFRHTNKNIGVGHHEVPVQLRSLLDDAMYWYENHTFVPDELAIRFKHRLVSIHCFANGNGRHSRLMADLVVEKLYKTAPFTWGAASLQKATDARANYMVALKAADAGAIEMLVAFARS